FSEHIAVNGECRHLSVRIDFQVSVPLVFPVRQVDQLALVGHADFLERDMRSYGGCAWPIIEDQHRRPVCSDGQAILRRRKWPEQWQAHSYCKLTKAHRSV